MGYLALTPCIDSQVRTRIATYDTNFANQERSWPWTASLARLARYFSGRDFSMAVRKRVEHARGAAIILGTEGGEPADRLSFIYAFKSI